MSLLELLFGSIRTKTNRNMVEAFNSDMTNIFISNMQKCLQSVTFSQDVTLVCNVPTDVALAFLNSAPCQQCQLAQSSNSSVDCLTLCYACVQGNIKQSATFEVSQTCKTDSTQSATIKTSINADIQQAITNKTSSFASLVNALPSLDKTPGAAGQNNTLNLTIQCQSLITAENVVSLLNSIDTSQSVTIVSNGGGSVQGGITQNLLFQTASSIIANNMQAAGVETTVALTASQGQASAVGGSADSASLAIYLGVGIGVLVLLIVLVIGVRAVVRKRQEEAAYQVPPASAAVVARAKPLPPTATGAPPIVTPSGGSTALDVSPSASPAASSPTSSPTSSPAASPATSPASSPNPMASR